MKISPINNAQPSSRARFSNADVKKLVDSTKGTYYSKEKIPQLYAMLEYVHCMPGDAKLLHENGHKSVIINGKVYGKVNEALSYFDALKKACVRSKDGLAFQPDNHIYMPESIFEQNWWKRKNVSADDVMTWGWM